MKMSDVEENVEGDTQFIETPFDDFLVSEIGKRRVLYDSNSPDNRNLILKENNWKACFGVEGSRLAHYSTSSRL